MTGGEATAPAIRRAAGADLAAVERLLVASGLPLDGVRAAFPGFVVAEHGGAVVGVAGLEPCGSHALVRSVAVDPAYRSRGVGRALVERVIGDADRRGCVALYLLTTTADRYFPAFGFTAVARDDVPAAIRATAEFRGACPASAIAMRRPAARSTAG